MHLSNWFHRSPLSMPTPLAGRQAALLALAALLLPVDSLRAAAAETVEIESIVAVVNTEVITHRELDARLAAARRQLARQKIAVPPAEALQRQVLERLILERVQLQVAKEAGIRVEEGHVEQSIGRIAESNGMTVAAFRKALEADGMSWERFREELQQEILLARVRDREVDNRVTVSDAEVDHAFEIEQRAGRERQEVDLGHIIVRVPESGDPTQVASLRARAEEARRKLVAGEDLARIAATYSDAADALQGGRIGVRSLDRLPTLYAEAARTLPVDGVSDLLRSAAGFHVVKLFARRGGAQAEPVRQTHARHILIRPDEILSDDEVQQRLRGFRERIVNGEAFAEIARINSQDGTAPKGGDLGWVYPGVTVPEFERAMDALAIGEVSRPVRSPFGWHLIQVIERRTAPVPPERQKDLLRQALRERKSDEAYQEWLRQIRDSAYVEIRIEAS
jgi:peptidyl-prolyl cis-trans isomerase SurA